jgi:transcription-repair coupling factor (superfamily II helicase)
MVDAHLPDSYAPGVETRLEAYRRLAGALTTSEIEDVAAEWEDRFGPLPVPALELLNIARLRVEALRIGITEIVQNRREVRISPVSMKASQEVRLERIARGSLLRSDTLYLPNPDESPATVITQFLRTMWPV